MGNEEITVAADTVVETKTHSYFRTLINLFWAPAKAFTSVSTKPRWVIPFLLCVCTAIIFEATTSGYRMAEAKSRIRSDSSISAAEAQQRIDAIDSQGTSSIQFRQVALAFGIFSFSHGLKLFGMALIIWLAVQLYSVKVRYVSILSMASFAFLVLLPEALFKIPLIRGKESTKIYLGPAAFLPEDWNGSILFRLMDGMNLFNIWMLLLLIIGLAILTGLSRRKAALTIGYLWFLWLAAASMFGQFIQIG